MSWESLQAETNTLLERAFRASQERYLHGSPMREMLDYHFQSGGKRLRPLLTYGSALVYS